MSKASRRRRTVGRKRKLDTLRESTGRVSQTIDYHCRKSFIDDMRERKAAVTGRADMPDDVLGILFGHKKIDDAEYNIGRKYQALGERIYGSPDGPGGAMFKESISPPNDEDAERNLEPMSDEEAQRMFMAMDTTLRRCGLLIHNVTVGAIRYGRYPQTLEQVDWVVKGLERLSAGRLPNSDTRPIAGDSEGQASGAVFYSNENGFVPHVERDGEVVRIVAMKRVARATIRR